MAVIKLFWKDKVQIAEVRATLMEGKGVILDTVWQEMWCAANVLASVQLVTFSEVLPLFPKSFA